MSYEHCKKHDADATNGCAECLADRVGDTMNKFLVGVRGNDVVVMNPPRWLLSRKEALVFAAWLVSLAASEDTAEFADVLRLVQSR